MFDNKVLSAKAKLINRWQWNPRLYCDQCLGIQQMWKLQIDFLDAAVRGIKEKKSIYIGSGHALSKDHTGGCIANWFLDCFVPSKVILTAPTDRQVKKIMWAETHDRFVNKKVPMFGKAFTNPYIEIDKDNWFLMGFTTKETGASAESGGGKFQGMRAAKNMCIIVTEAQAVEDNIFDQIDSVSQAENCLIIYLGNPTRATGRFAKGLKDKVNNIVFNFSCLESPNYKAREVIIPGVATYEWVEDKRKRWGEDDPRWISRVLGQIPDNATCQTFPQSLIDLMKARYGLLAPYSNVAGVSVDPAGEGVDEDVFLSGKNGDPVDCFHKTSMSPGEKAIKALEICRAIHGQFIVIDCDGVGIGTWQELDRMSEDLKRGIQIIKFHGCSTKTNTMVTDDRGGERPVYENVRSEASFITRQRAQGGQCSITNDIEMIEDLMEEEYFTNRKGLIQIEPKEDIKERLGRSPGKGDAYKMLQWAFEMIGNQKDYPDAPDGNVVDLGAQYSNSFEFDSRNPQYAQ